MTWGQWVEGIVPDATERVIELPLAYAVMAVSTPGRVLDAGCACNQPLANVTADVVHLTQSLSHERQFPGRQYVAGDLRDLSIFPDGAFDRVVCVSTLEHVGYDNTRYGGPVESDPGTVVMAVAELWRVCRGVLFLTVPFRLQPWACEGWRYFTPDTVSQLIPVGTVPTIRYYGRAAAGWFGGSPVPFWCPFIAAHRKRVSMIACLQVTR